MADLLLQLDAENEEPVLHWQEIFGNRCPVEIELGIGKGRFLIDAAQRHPDTNFVGVEWAAKYLRIATERSVRRRLGNIRFARVDARDFVEFFVPSVSVRAYHIYFPDPWPKKRHHKRRLVNTDFLVEVERTLEYGGRLWMATDHGEYFQSMEDILSGTSLLHDVESDWIGVQTNYEEKYIAEGKVIHRMMMVKDSVCP